MTIEKLKSGKYRVVQMVDGKRYRVTLDHKPTKKEAEKVIREEISAKAVPKIKMTFEQAAKSYIDSRRNVLSPSTLREYEGIMRRFSEVFRLLPLAQITQLDVQTEINELSLTRAPKTIRNYHGFISAVLGMFRPDLMLSTTLPQKVKHEPYVPTESDIKTILDHVKGTDYEIPFKLACYGMRRSEICALTPDDISEDGLVIINKAVVLDPERNWVVKQTKTTSSTREIIISPDLVSLIRSKGYVYRGHPNSLTDYVMKNIYRHSLAENQRAMKKRASDMISRSLF